MGIVRHSIVVLAVGAASLFAGCYSTPARFETYNVFARNQPPRYGHGGTLSPTATGRYEGPIVGRYGSPGLTAERFPQSQGTTVYLDQRPPVPPPVAPGYRGPGAPPTGPVTQIAAPPGSQVRDEPVVVDRGVGGGPPARMEERPEPSPEPEPEPVATSPYAEPVAGKPGFVYSPFDGQKRLVNVVDIPPGTEVKCPYTDKVFKVP